MSTGTPSRGWRHVNLGEIGVGGGSLLFGLGGWTLLMWEFLPLPLPVIDSIHFQTVTLTASAFAMAFLSIGLVLAVLGRKRQPITALIGGIVCGVPFAWPLVEWFYGLIWPWLA